MTNPTIVSPVKMEYGWNFSMSGLKVVKSGLEELFLKFLHALAIFYFKQIFLIERRNFDQKYKFSNKNKMVSAWRNFKNIFSRPLFTIIFRPEMLIFYPYSILTGNTRVEFVIYCVLRLIAVKWQCEMVRLNKWLRYPKYSLNGVLPHKWKGELQTKAKLNGRVGQMLSF